MEQLIWFSIPGALLCATLFVVCSSSADEIVLWIAVAPVIGFVVHQVFRLGFEVAGGFASKRRKVLYHIIQDLEVVSYKQAFLVWEVTFYSNDMPASFRDHDRGAWHYILSFWGISLAAFVSLGLCLLGYLLVAHRSDVLYMALAQLVVLVIFALKGWTTYQSLMEQELAVFHVLKTKFRDIAKQI